MNLCFKAIDNFSESYLCGCTLVTYGYATGILGIVWRTVSDMYMASLFWGIKEHDPEINTIILITLLSYVSLTLGFNFIFFLGLVHENRYLLIPYLLVAGLEIFFAIIILAFGSKVLSILELQLAFWVFLVFSILFIIIKIFMWLQTIRLFKYIECTLQERAQDDKIYEEMLRRSVMRSM